MGAPIWLRYNNIDYDLSPNTIWDDVKSFYDAKIKLDGMHELAKPDNCQLVDYPSVAEWIVAQDQIVDNIVITGMEADRCHYIIKYIPTTPEWTRFVGTLELIAELMTFWTRLRWRKDSTPGDALFFARKNKSRKQSVNKSSNDSDKQQIGKTVTCYGCSVKGHKKNQCRNPDKWT